MERARVKGRRLLLTSLRLLLATLLCAAGLALPRAASFAAEPERLVTIMLDSISPSLPDRDGAVTISGTVTNVTDRPLYRLQAIFWRNQAPITSREEFAQALDSPANEPYGARLTRSYDDLYQPDDPYLDPGASAPFTLQAEIGDLALSPTSGIYLMGVHVLENGKPRAVGRARVFVPVLSGAPRQTLELTSLVVLRSRPSQLRLGVLADDHLAAEVASGGRLDVLLTAAARPGMSLAVDPALVDELKTMRDGYQVLTPDGSTRPGSGTAAARRWLEELAEVMSDREGYRLPYATPDLAALAHSRFDDLLDRISDAPRSVAETSSLPLLALPAAGAADRRTLRLAERLDPAAILVSDTSAAGDGPLLKGIRSAPLLRFSSTAFDGGPGPDPQDTSVHLQQRILADTWLEATAGVPTPARLRLITTAEEATSDSPTRDAPWVRRVPLDRLLQSTPLPWSQKLRYTDAMRKAELTRAHLAACSALTRLNRTYAELLTDPGQAGSVTSEALARCTSSTWRGQEDASEEFVQPQQRQLSTALRDGVELSTTPRVTTSGARGFFPITVANQLPESDDPENNAVRVRVRFTSDNPQRVTIEPLVTDAIPAQGSFTGNAQVNASTNGTVRVRAQMTTLSGTPVGRPIDIDVKVTQAGTVGWFIAIGAGAVLIGATALRIRQVAKERSEGASAAEPSGSPAGGEISPPPVTPPAAPEPRSPVNGPDQ